MRSRRSGWGRRGARRAVSEVVATILLLAMTVVLFTTIFLWTNKLGSSQSVSPSSFTATLGYASSSSSQVTSVSITHLTGPVLPAGSTGGTSIYIVSQKHPSAFSNPYSVAAGLPGAAVWSFGQTWKLDVSTYSITAPDNLTVSVLSNGGLVFTATLLATSPATPPSLTQGFVKTTPSPPVHGTSFTFNVSAFVTFAIPTGATVSVNLSEIGGSSIQAMTGSGNGLWYYVGSATVTTAKVCFLFVTATGGAGLQSTLAVQLTIS